MTSCVSAPAEALSGPAKGRTLTLHLKVRPEAWPWLDQAAREVNQVWNWANETSRRAVQTFAGPAQWLSGYDLDKLSAGGAAEFERIGSDTIQRINAEFATRRRQFRKVKLRFRKSTGSRRSLGWIPFKGVNLRIRAVKTKAADAASAAAHGLKPNRHHVRGKSSRQRGRQGQFLPQPPRSGSGPKSGYRLTFFGKTIRLFQMGRLIEHWQSAHAIEKPLGAGSFAQNALGEWFLNVAVTVPYPEGTTFDPTSGEPRLPIAPRELVGLDPGRKAVLTTSDGEVFEPNRSYRKLEPIIAALQRHGHKKQAKRVLRKAAHVRANATHQISRYLINTYQNLKLGDVSLSFLRSGNGAKSALDSGLGMLKAQLVYKGRWAGRCVQTVSECNTTRACSSCGALLGPTGWTGLVVRTWTCGACGVMHDRDVNAAINIARVGSSPTPGRVCAEVSASVSGNTRDGNRPLCQPPPARRNRDGRFQTVSS